MARTGWLSARGLAAFAGGASVAVIASRLLPPLFAQAVADVTDPFGGLIEDHRRFLALLTEMEEARGKSPLYRGQLLLRLKRSLASHALAEEDVIYPLLREEAGDDVAADRLYAEHGEIKTHLYALERAIRDETAWATRAAALKALIDRHGRQEEEVEFPRLRALLDEESIGRVARHVRREKALIL